MSEIRFVIPGAAVGKGRPKFARRGNFVKAYTPQPTVSYENLVKTCAHAVMGGRGLFDGPVKVEIDVFVTPPESWSNKKKLSALAGEVRPTSKPDLDNVAKAIFDALNEIVWKDDKQIVCALLSKSYAAKAETLVCIFPA